MNEEEVNKWIEEYNRGEHGPQFMRYWEMLRRSKYFENKRLGRYDPLDSITGPIMRDWALFRGYHGYNDHGNGD